MRVLVTGATGRVGSRLCEVLHLTDAITPRAVVHSTGAASRIARYPIEFAVGDLCDAAFVHRSMESCDAVVHLARGSEDVMRRGLENVLRAAIEQRVSRFVHISSVAVYGGNPPPESVSEDAPAHRTELGYGNEKLEQEHRVKRYMRRYGLPAVILRPPNVYGPYSLFTVGLLERIRTGKVAIVDGGANPCSLVYVDNLVDAIILALWKPAAVDETFFIVDKETVTWEQCLQDHATMLGISLPHVNASELVQRRREKVLLDSLKALPKAVASPEFRQVVRQIPFCRRVELFLYRRFESLSSDQREKIRLWVHGPELRLSPAGEPTGYDASDGTIAAQFRRVAHSSEKASRLLGYNGFVSYTEGMELTREWLRFSRLI